MGTLATFTLNPYPSPHAPALEPLGMPDGAEGGGSAVLWLFCYLLVSPLASPTQDSSASCGALGLTPCPSRSTPCEVAGLSAVNLPLAQPPVAERGRISRRRGPAAPASFKTHPSPGLSPQSGSTLQPGEGQGVGVNGDRSKLARSRWRGHEAMCRKLARYD